MVKGLEEKPCEKKLWKVGLFSLEEIEVEPHCGLQCPHEGKWRGRH